MQTTVAEVNGRILLTKVILGHPSMRLINLQYKEEKTQSGEHDCFPV